MRSIAVLIVASALLAAACGGGVEKTGDVTPSVVTPDVPCPPADL